MLRRVVPRSVGVAVRTAILCAALLALMAPMGATAQQATPCIDCVLYAYTDLNLRKGPAIDTVVLASVPKGAAVRRTAGAEINGYAPVTYAGIPGWVVALGLVASPAAVAPDAAPAAAAPPLAAANQRVTLSALNLRVGPSPDAAVITTLPAGSVVTLTGAGAEGGYVTVDANGNSGWVYADLIGSAS